MRTPGRHRWMLLATVLTAVIVAASLLSWKQKPDAEYGAQISIRSDAEFPTQVSASHELFTGRIVDAATRTPIEHFRISLEPWAPPEVAADPPSQARVIGPFPAGTRSGRFRLQGLPRGEWRLIIRATNYEPFQARLLIADERQSSDFVLPLRRGQSLSGQVYDQSNGNGIRGATLVFRDDRTERRGSHWRTPPSTRTIAGGYFTIEGVPVGPLKLEVEADGFASRRISFLASGGPAQPLEVWMDTRAP